MKLATIPKPDVVSATPEELVAFCKEIDEPSFRGLQLFDWLQKRSVIDPALMTNLSKQFRAKLTEMDLSWPAEVGRVLNSSDGTRKLEIKLEDGLCVETVLIPEGDRLTQCISSQVGCAVGCRFCRSGSEGLTRNLSASEIISQIHLAKEAYLPSEQLRNIVIMGVGEPLHNTERVIRAIRLMVHKDGLDLSSRRVTLSTVGVMRGLDRLASELGGNVALAVSLHAGSNEARQRLVPFVSDSLEDIVAALGRYPLPKRRRITIEYVLIKGVNDSDAEARRLAKLLSSLKVKINLLPLNPHDRTPWEPPDDERVLAFQKILLDKGYSVLLRKKRGDDINAACGQLLSTQPKSIETPM